MSCGHLCEAEAPTEAVAENEGRNAYGVGFIEKCSLFFVGANCVQNHNLQTPGFREEPEFFHDPFDYLLKQFRVTTDAIEHQYQYIVNHFIHKQPIRRNVAFSAAFVVTGQIVVTIFCRQSNSVCQQLHHIKKYINILAFFLPTSNPF